MSCSIAKSSKINYISEIGIENRNTFSEKAGRVFSSAIARLVQAIKYPIDKIGSGIHFLARKIGGCKTIQNVAERVLRPIKDAGVKAYLRIKDKIQRLVEKINPGYRLHKLSQWSKARFALLNEKILQPALCLGQKVLDLGKAPLRKVSEALRKHVIQPVWNVARQLFSYISRAAGRVLKPVGERVVKPAARGVDDFINGIFRNILIRGEITEEKLMGMINADEEDCLFDSEVDFNLFLAGRKGYHEFNAAMALFLIQKHSLVIDRKWVQSDRVSHKLSSMLIRRCQYEGTKQVIRQGPLSI